MEVYVKYEITWEAIYEGIWFTEFVNQKELDDRLADKTIRITALRVAEYSDL